MERFSCEVVYFRGHLFHVFDTDLVHIHDELSGAAQLSAWLWPCIAQCIAAAQAAIPDKCHSYLVSDKTSQPEHNPSLRTLSFQLNVGNIGNSEIEKLQ